MHKRGGAFAAVAAMMLCLPALVSTASAAELRKGVVTANTKSLTFRKLGMAPVSLGPSERARLDEALRARYAREVRRVVDARWMAFSAPKGVRCNVRFTQIPGGMVIRVEFLECPFDAQARQFVARALQAEALPYLGFERVFSPAVTMGFCRECKPASEQEPSATLSP